MPTISQPPFSHRYTTFTPDTYDPMFSMPILGTSMPSSVHSGYEYGSGNGNGNCLGQALTPGGESLSTEGEKDPFLSLLEQLAEIEQSRGGPNELDFFLGGSSG
jgi:hypothetical protein